MWLYEVTFVLVPALGYSKWKPWLVTVIVLCLLVYLGTPLTDRMLCLLSICNPQCVWVYCQLL